MPMALVLGLAICNTATTNDTSITVINIKVKRINYVVSIYQILVV